MALIIGAGVVQGGSAGSDGTDEAPSIGAEESSAGGVSNQSIGSDESSASTGASSSPDASTSASSTTSVDGPDVMPSGTRWILVLHSTEKSMGLAEARRQADLIDPSGQVLVIDSDAYPSLNPGYFAVVGYGYASEEQARSSCATFGLPVGGACYPRQVP
jgi:hypothetical protein